MPISLNMSLDERSLHSRIQKFYLPYQRTLNEIVFFLRPRLVLNVHSHQSSELDYDLIVKTTDKTVSRAFAEIKGVKVGFEGGCKSQTCHQLEVF